MVEKFVVTQRKNHRKGVQHVVMSLRIDQELQEEFDKLAIQSERSRNELMCMALRYALEHLEFIPGAGM